MSCGLKNSGCRNGDEDDQGTDVLEVPVVNGTTLRFTFVDQRTGLWSPYADYNPQNNNATGGDAVVDCPIGGMVVFYFDPHYHDVQRMPDRTAWNSCDFGNATLLAPSPDDVINVSKYHDTLNYYYMCNTAGETAYLACSIGRHCALGQKIVVQTSATYHAFNATTHTWNTPVNSLARLLVLLGYRYNAALDIYVIDRGYQTEHLANVTTDLIWCALEHDQCPALARDVIPNATTADCQCVLYTLLGLISRKRPRPQYHISEHYYRRAIALPGAHVDQVCTARSYLASLYANRGNLTSAAATRAIRSLCQNCQGTVLTQAKYEWQQVPGGLDVWERTCIPSAASAAAAVAAGPSVPSLLFVVLLLAWYNNKLVR